MRHRLIGNESLRDEFGKDAITKVHGDALGVDIRILSEVSEDIEGAVGKQSVKVGVKVQRFPSSL